MYSCGSRSLVFHEPKTGTLINTRLYCGNIRKCDNCRAYMTKNTVERMFRYCGSLDWFIGKSDLAKSSDVARSIGRSGGYYIRIPQDGFALFIATNPRRLNDASPLEMDRVAIRIKIDDSIQSMPDGARSTTNLPELPKEEREFEYYLPGMTPAQVDSAIIEAGNSIKNMTTRYSAFRGNESSISNALIAIGVECPEFPKDDSYLPRP